ncbi:MAG TPA: 3-keto-5-aminohexanoate cleavage protein [Chthoniobacterales bacterium]|nr:3-keto-5-aminohexanoate cleavage protein [Chthoniobacterales bacterium]
MIVQACLNGHHPPDYHPALPVTIQALVDDGWEVVIAGASELHIHVRDQNGLESLQPDRVDATMRALKARLPGTLIGISTGAWIEKDDDRLFHYVTEWQALPDYASVNLSEKNAPALMERLHRLGIAIEAGLARPEDAERLLALGLVRFALRILVEVNEQDLDRAPVMAEEILSVLKRLDASKPILLHGMNASAWPLLRRAIELGFSSRIGLEDVSTLPDGTPARSNAELVSAAVSLARTAAFSGRNEQ